MEEERRVYGGYPPVKRVERCQTPQIWRGVGGRAGGRKGRHDLEVFRVEGITRDECYRIRLRGRPEEFMSEVPEFCEVRVLAMRHRTVNSLKHNQTLV